MIPMKHNEHVVDIPCCKRTGWADKEIITVVIDWLIDNLETDDWCAYVHDDSTLESTIEERIKLTYLRVGFKNVDEAVLFKLTHAHMLTPNFLI